MTLQQAEIYLCSEYPTSSPVPVAIRFALIVSGRSPAPIGLAGLSSWAEPEGAEEEARRKKCNGGTGIVTVPDVRILS